MSHFILQPARTAGLIALITALAAANAGAQDPDAYWQDATLYRDASGVPHIYANTVESMAFVFGYSQAEDHLETMLLAYRMPQGRLSEVLGDAHEKSDRFAIRAGHRQVAQAAYSTASADTRALCDGFARGVNAFLLEHPDKAPAWAEAIHPADILALWHAYLVYYAPYDLPDSYRPQPPAHSGTAIAVAPFRNPSGAALLAINPHQFYDGPFQWYEAHLRVPGYDVYGVTLYGLPIIVQGHNHSIAWAMTPNFPDFADMFYASFAEYKGNPKSPTLPNILETEASRLFYLTQARTFRVAGRDGMREEAEISFLTDDGPIVEDSAGSTYIWHVGGYTALEGLAQLAAMGRAESLAGFQAALEARQIPCFHLLYADRSGELFYLYNATVPDKIVEEIDLDTGDSYIKEIDWSRPVERRYEVYAWDEPVALDQLPYIANPESGFLIASGSPPWQATRNAKFETGRWPNWFIQDADRFRSQWLRRHLRAGMRSAADIQALLFDSTVPAAESLVPWLLAVAADRQVALERAHPALPEAIALLRSWNYRTTVDSEAMTLFARWWERLVENAGTLFPNVQALIDALLANGPQAQDMAMNSLIEAVQLLMNTHGTVHVPWIPEDAAVDPGRAAGAIIGDPVFVGGYVPAAAPGYATKYGYGPTLVVELSDPPLAWSTSPVRPAGTSAEGDGESELLFHDRAFKPAPFLSDRVWRAAVSARGRSVTLLPRAVSGMVQILAPTRIDASVLTHAVDQVPPQGTAFFTFPVEARVSGSGPVEIRYQITVPPEICADEDIERLSLCRRGTGNTWEPLEEQLLDAANRTLSGILMERGMVAILGPDSAYLPGKTQAVEKPEMDTDPPLGDELVPEG